MAEQSRGSLLIVAVSGRALARAAVDAGYEPLVADFFADLDTRELAKSAQKIPGDVSAGLKWETLEPLLSALCADARAPIMGVVYGSGFEDRPQLLDRIAKRWPLLGNNAATVAAVNDPGRFFAALARLSIRHPETRLDLPRDCEGWVAKRLGGAGGSHIAPPSEQMHRRGFYFQKFVTGRAVSALFASNGTRSTVLGISEQWTSPVQGKPWRYGGAVQPARVQPDIAERMENVVSKATQHFRLRGLNSADLLLDGDEPLLLEINPRPGGTLDIFSNTSPALMDIHLNAVLYARLPARALTVGGAAASAIVFAPDCVTVPEAAAWPDGAADLPKPGERIDKERPICTLFARARSADAARRLVQAQSRSLLATLGAAQQLAYTDRLLG